MRTTSKSDINYKKVDLLVPETQDEAELLEVVNNFIKNNSPRKLIKIIEDASNKAV